MYFTIIVSRANPEVIWNAFRFGNLVLNQFDEVFFFLNGPAVTFRRLSSERFPLEEVAKTFVLNEGQLFG